MCPQPGIQFCNDLSSDVDPDPHSFWYVIPDSECGSGGIKLRDNQS